MTVSKLHDATPPPATNMTKSSTEVTETITLPAIEKLVVKSPILVIKTLYK
jgi:hypothetical protein